MQKKLEKKVAIITGSSRGIGKSIALSFAQEGADVIVCFYKRENQGLQVKNEIRKLGANSIVLKLDITFIRSIKNVVKQTIKEFKKADILVNNAGYLNQNNFEDITEENYDKTLNTNLKGAFFLSQAIWPYFKRQRYGRIINIASVGGQFGGSRAPHYSASKAGLISLTKSLARLGAAHNILVNTISPGLIMTDMTKKIFKSPVGKTLLKQVPLKRFGKPEEVAKAAVFLASDDASYITGQTINVNGGYFLG